MEIKTFILIFRDSNTLSFTFVRSPFIFILLCKNNKKKVKTWFITYMNCVDTDECTLVFSVNNMRI